MSARRSGHLAVYLFVIICEIMVETMPLLLLQTVDEEAGHSDHDCRRHQRVKFEDAVTSPLAANPPKRVRIVETLRG